ncbi:NAD(P)H-dependent glycerol-3-phosphate dehydrogenase [Mycoplasma sp. Ms02]|uniref:NAD(P)H-dependent glycerol-3-phosphate dehydrogenase n=1 Tax=Mycoplasma sp. Ms02 TaxID=353851 RepID=UPI001C8A679C|nr:NAD(P)H-dependent glycerol-3-phosphate dehydrogenase [Mycoplasma sp. Ms02]QZE12627.1 NAD(P)-binding domain-containing protein [Mycoplasma sp. Ms02]
MTLNNKIAIIGTGAFGSALANVLLHNKINVEMYGIDLKEIQDIKQGKNSKYFENSVFNNPEYLDVEEDFEELVKNNETFLLAVPSKFIKSTLQKMSTFLGKRKVNIINVSKGIDLESNLLFSELIERSFSNNLLNTCSLIGPSFATEIFNGQKTIVNVVSKNLEYAKNVAKMFENNYFKVLPSDKVVGAEFFSALKNVLAIGSGILHSITEEKNTISSFLALGISEISRMGQKLYPQNSFDINDFSLCSIGDVFLTCTSNKSRNFSFGESIYKTGLKASLSQNQKTIEGYETALIIDKMFEFDDSYPVFAKILQILKNEAQPSEIINI